MEANGAALESVEKDANTPTEKSKEIDNLNGSATPPSAPSSDERDDQTSPPDAGYPSGARLWLTLAALSFVIILGGLDFSIVGVAVPAITERFHTIADVGWYSVSYRLTACVSQFAWGQVYTIFSVKRALSTAIVIFLVGSAVSAAATSSVMVVVGRAVTGVGSAGVLGGVFTALMVVAPLRIRPILTSLLGALEAVAMVMGPIVGGLLTQNTSWRWCFYINLPVGGLALACLVLFLKDSPPSGAGKEPLTWKQVIEKMDLVSNVFLVGSLTSLFIALSWAGAEYSWSSATIIGLLVTFAACLLIFAFAQYRRGDDATLPPRIMKQRSVMGGALFSLCLNGALGVLEYYIPIYFQVVRGWTPGKAGYMMLPITVGFNISLLIQGFCTSWVGYYTPFAILSSIILPVGAGLVSTWNSETDLARLIVYSGMVGFGSGLAFEVPQIAVQTVLSEDDGALGLSVTLFAQNFGGAIFISIAQQVFTGQLLANLEGKVPNLTPSTVQSLGFVDIPGSSMNGTSHEVLDGMQNSFLHVWYIAIALACVMIVGSLAMEWRSVKSEEDDEKSQETSDGPALVV